MDESNKYKNLSSSQPDGDSFFSGGEFKWKKSREEVWKELEAKMQPAPPVRTIRLNFTRLSVAAGFLLILGLTAFMRYYTLSVSTESLVHRIVDLPDGSTVELNANSKLTYYPHWWRIHRILSLEGEAFFDVEKGRKFTVNSAQGKIEVLGTSFNVFAQHDILKVTCITGKVRVVSGSKVNEEVVISPNTTAELKTNRNINVKEEADTFQDVAWRKGTFYFTASPVQDVFSQFEQQYGVSIDLDFDSSLIYTGNFRIESNVETVLGYVCPALGLTFEQESPGKYLIVKDDE